MNAIQLKERVDSYNDRSKSPRFLDTTFINCLNAAITQTFENRTQSLKENTKYDLQSNEQVQRELYTLIKTATIVPAGDLVIYPNDYRYFGSLFTTVDGIRTYARPLEFSMEGPIEEDSFRKPKPSKTYYMELANAFKIKHNGTSFTSADFNYLKYPNVVSIGQESNKIFGGGTLTINTVYIVYDDAVHNGVSYVAGATFNSLLVTPLTSGTVIQLSVIVDTDMPENIQDELCRITSELMQETIEDYNKEQTMEKEAGKV